jgi:hypothetical protein
VVIAGKEIKKGLSDLRGFNLGCPFVVHLTVVQTLS